MQAHVQNSLGQLEALNRHYRKLAREGRTDEQSVIKQQCDDVNAQWDKLQERTVAINRRLRHILNVKDDFDATRKALIVWLSDVSMRLSNIEYMRDGDSALRHHSLQVRTHNLVRNCGFDLLVELSNRQRYIVVLCCRCYVKS